MCELLNNILSRYDVFEASREKVLKRMDLMKADDEDPLVLFAWNSANLNLFRDSATAVADVLSPAIDCTSTTTFLSSMVKYITDGVGVQSENVYSCVGFCCTQLQFGAAICFLGTMQNLPWVQAVLQNYNGRAIAAIMMNKPYSRIHEMARIEMHQSRLWEGPNPDA